MKCIDETHASSTQFKNAYANLFYSHFVLFFLFNFAFVILISKHLFSLSFSYAVYLPINLQQRKDFFFLILPNFQE